VNSIWQRYKQERGCLMQFARLAKTVPKDEESARDNHVLACNQCYFSYGFPVTVSVKVINFCFFQLQLLFFSFSYLTPNTNTDRTHVAYSLLRRTCIFFNCNTGVA